MIRLLPLVCILIAILSCGDATTSDAEISTATEKVDWKQALMLFRQNKDNGFAMQGQSPISNDNLSFQGLNYYEPDSNFRVKFTLDTVTNVMKEIEIPDSKGEKRKLKYCGELRFEIASAKCSLPAYIIPEDPAHFFVMFRDLTNGKETYGGGRYLELQVTDKEGFMDFNYAYNPYCHYNHNFSCPIVPAGCKLNVEVKAGEKTYK